MSPLAPVGVPGGLVSGLGGSPTRVEGLVRLGEEVLSLDPARYLLWRGCSVVPDEASLLEWAGRKGIEAADSLLRTLKDTWLVVELRPDRPVHAARLALRIAGELAGNGTTGVLRFSVLGRGTSAVVVEAGLYEVLLRSDGTRSIAEVCEEVDRLATHGSPQALPPVFESLPLLIRSGAVGLDLARRR